MSTKNLQAYKLGVVIDAQGAKALATLRDVDKQAGRTQASLNALAHTGGTWGRNLTVGVTAPLIGLGVAAGRSATQLDSLKRGLATVAGSSAEAERQLVRLKEVARLPGLGFKEAVQGSINLQAAGYSATFAERSLKAFGNALVSVGKGKNELDGINLALTQMATSPKVLQEEINQIRERLPQFTRLMVNAFGTARSEDIQKLGISGKEFVERMVIELEKLPKVTGGAQVTFENLADTAEQALEKIGTPILRTVVPALERLAPRIEAAADAFGKLSPEAQDAALGVGAVTLAAGPAISTLANATIVVSGMTGAAMRLYGALGSVAGALRIVQGLAPGALAALSGTLAVGAGALIQDGSSPYTNKLRSEADARAEQARLAAGGAARDKASRDKLFGQFQQVGPRGLGEELAARTARIEAAKASTPLPAGKKTGGGGGGSARQVASDARAIQDAYLEIERNGLENRLRVEQAGLERRNRVLRDLYEAGFFTARQYYERTATAAAEGVAAELRALTEKQTLLGREQALSKPGSPEALRTQGQILQLDTERYLKLAEGIAQAAENAREFARAMGELNGEIDLAQQQAQVIDIVPEIIRRARARNASLSATAGRGDLIEAEFDRDRERIQTRVVEGTLTEAAARRQILALEADYRAKLLEVLEAKKELAGLDEAAIAALDAQIARAKQLGVVTPASKERKSVFLDKPLSVNDASGVANPAASAAQSAVAGLKTVGDEAGALFKGGFGQLATGLGGIIEQFVLLGETGPGAMKKLAAGVLASLAMQAATKSIFYFAEGVAAATNPFTAYMAPGYFTASAVMAGIAAGSALGGRALSGKSDKGQISDEQRRQATIANVSSESYAGNQFTRRERGGNVMAGRAYLVGERRAEVVEFPSNGYVHSSVDEYQRKRASLERTRAALGGNSPDGFIGRIFAKLLAKLDDQFARLEAVKGDDVMLRVMERNPRAVGRATVNALDQDDQLSSRLGRRIAA